MKITQPHLTVKPIFLTLSNSKVLAEKTTQILKTPLYFVEKQIFADKEIIIQIPVSVREKDVFLFQSTNNPANEHLMELFITIDALKRSGARSISLIMPYFGYARQDRKTKGRQPITASLIANLLTQLKIKRIITFDLHSLQIQGFFDIPVVHLSALPLLIHKFLTDFQLPTDFMLVAPDYGGHNRVQHLNNYLDRNIAVISKRRPNVNEAQINFILGSVAGKNVLLIDDLIDTGNTILENLKFLKHKQAQQIDIVATHAVFSNDALVKFANAYQNKLFNHLIVSDTIFLQHKAQYPFLVCVSVADFLAKTLEIITVSGSVSQLNFEQLQKLRRNHA